MTTSPNSPEARDVAYHLHSYTNGRLHQERGPLVIERGDGIYVEDQSGRRYIEAMAGLWSVAVGFSEPRLVAAATRQMERLPYYHTFTHKSHGPVIDLAEKLVTMAPVPMSKAYFTNSGSEANDTVLKLLWYRSNAMGEPQRKKVISRHSWLSRRDNRLRQPDGAAQQSSLFRSALGQYSSCFLPSSLARGVA